MYGSRGASSQSFRLVPEMYLSQIPKASFLEDRFTKELNPTNRIRELSHLYSRDPYDALILLPKWEQVHELDYLFLDLDVLVAYTIEEEDYYASGSRSSTNPARMHGFTTCI